MKKSGLIKKYISETMTRGLLCYAMHAHEVQIDDTPRLEPQNKVLYM